MSSGSTRDWPSAWPTSPGPRARRWPPRAAARSPRPPRTWSPTPCSRPPAWRPSPSPGSYPVRWPCCRPRAPGVGEGLGSEHVRRACVVVGEPGGAAALRVAAVYAPSPCDRQISPPGGPARRQVVAQTPLARGEHHPACSRPASALVPGQASERVGGLYRERCRQDRAILDRLAGALPQIGQHRMCGIAQDGDPAARPLRDRVAVIQRPLVPGVRGGEEAKQGFVPSGVALEHLFAAALGNPGFVAIAVVIVVADDVDQLLAPQRVQHDRAVRAKPLGTFGTGPGAADGAGPNDAAITDLSCEPGGVRAEQRGAHR